MLSRERLAAFSADETAAPEPAPRALTDVIGTIAAELEQLAVCGEGLQDLAARVMLEQSSDALVTDLQVVDLLVQRLNALSTFARTLAPSLPAEWRIDVSEAAGSVTLAGTRQRLEGSVRPAEGEEPAGDCDFF